LGGYVCEKPTSSSFNKWKTPTKAGPFVFNSKKLFMVLLTNAFIYGATCAESQCAECKRTNVTVPNFMGKKLGWAEGLTQLFPHEIGHLTGLKRVT
jgi:hypothetical protein